VGVRSFAIITTIPTALCPEIHNRMPVILKPGRRPAWLGEEPTAPPWLKALLAPLFRRNECWSVGLRGGNVKNNDPSLIAPIAAFGKSIRITREETWPTPALLMISRWSAHAWRSCAVSAPDPVPLT
jgi:hypothetical protein